MNIYDHLYVLMNNEPGDEEGEGTPDPAAAATAGGEAATDEDKPSPFRQGVEKAARIEQGAPAEPETPDPEAPAPDGKPEGETPPVDDEAAAAEAKKKADDEFKAEVDTEVKDLGLKGRSEARFRDMATKLREKDEQIAEYETVKAELPNLRASAEAAEKWEDALASVGAGEQQFGNAMGYFFAINKGTKEQKLQALEMLDKEREWLAKEIGLKTDTYNPIDEHPDLKARVESGDLDEADALELIEGRRVKATQEKETAAEKTARESAEARTAALGQVREFEVGLKKTDPQYAIKLRMLAPHIELVAQTLPPAKWLGAIQSAYQAINLPKVAAPTPKPAISRVPVRGGASHQQVEAPTKANAFRFGVEKAKKAGM